MTEPSPYTTPAPAPVGPGGPDAAATSPASGRNPQWAQPIQAQGLENFHQVSPTLFRGAQPSVEGFKELKKRGIKTIISLRAWHSDEGKIDDAGLTGEFKITRIYFKSWHVESEDIDAFLTAVTDPANQPVFVHCLHGSDRTGLMCAVYRIAVQNWAPDQANDEFLHGDYGFHAIWQNLPNYLGNLTEATVARWRALVAKATPATPAAPATPAGSDTQAPPPQNGH